MSQSILFRRKLFSLIFIFNPLMVLYSAETGLKTIETKMRGVAIVLAPKLKGRVCVMDFSESEDRTYTSEFGQMLAEATGNQLLNQKKVDFEVVARKELVGIVRDSMVFGDDDATFKRLRKEAQMDTMISGTYWVVDSEIAVTIKATSAQLGQVIASSSFRIPKTDGFEKMLIHRFKSVPDPQDKPELGGGDILEMETGVYYEGGDGKLYPVREGMVLTSKDNFSVYVRPQKECHLYIYQIDSTQKAFKLFPNDEFSRWKNPIKSGVEMWIPEKDFLYLDENVGQEIIYIFATHSASPGLDSIREVSLGDIENSIKTMGVAGHRGSEVVRQVKGTQGNGIELIQRKLYSRGDFFYKLSFIHR